MTGERVLMWYYLRRHAIVTGQKRSRRCPRVRNRANSTRAASPVQKKIARGTAPLRVLAFARPRITAEGLGTVVENLPDPRCTRKRAGLVGPRRVARWRWSVATTPPPRAARPQRVALRAQPPSLGPRPKNLPSQQNQKILPSTSHLPHSPSSSHIHTCARS